jgi:uncharacterized membrane protein
MNGRAVPLGWSYNPSQWRHRWPVCALAILGFGIATYLTLYQLGVVQTVWEPFFGNGSRRILKESAIARLMPIPDASLGALAYLVEAICEAVGGEARWRGKPWIVLLVGLVSAALGLTGVLLAISQPTLFGAFCTLCLCSATCSVLIFGLAIGEVLATLQYLKREMAGGRSIWGAVFVRSSGASGQTSS